VATCETWWSTVTLPALLSKSLSVTGLSPGTLSLSRYVTQKLTCSRDPRIAADQLRELIARQHFDWIVVADDALFRGLIESGEREALHGWFPVDPARNDILAFVTSKHEFALRAAEFGIPVPESRLFTGISECVEHASTLGYPIIAKGPHGFSGSEVSVATSESELRSAGEKMLGRYGKVLLQRFVSGASASAAVLYERGRAIAYKAYFTECQYPSEHSAATVHRPLRHASIEPIVRAIGTATGFHGMAGIDFVLETGTDRLFAIEINPRPTSAFSGLRADRAFFAPAIARFLCGDSEVVERFEIGEAPQAYFPDYAFYFFDRVKKSKADYRHLRSALSEAAGSELPIVAWATARYAYDRVGRFAPGLRAWLDSLRRARGSSPQID
jgi:glutathione synthase/RimK-type ligase-like ATP-grasp enzyme